MGVVEVKMLGDFMFIGDRNVYTQNNQINIQVTMYVTVSFIFLFSIFTCFINFFLYFEISRFREESTPYPFRPTTRQ